ncbi:BrnT family toxin [Tianweitania populi]|uniref:BrnT family toxin n=1 Tax=Tianweitania populi TaxID=1607949 RepID=A0A8J3DMZ9_9HYPH|nr:BrnT family toxin [Tianweitania populi]GHD10531.1 hypothetical protein GCM10016234_12490 [Tianweitania populi]
MRFDGFDWDAGNWPKCSDHGVSKAEIESIFFGELQTNADPSQLERRFRAIGQLKTGRPIFVVYTLRRHEKLLLIRPISARFMHEKEIKRYEHSKL